MYIYIYIYIYNNQNVIKTFCSFHRFLIYDFYFGTYSSKALNIYYVTNYLYIYYDLLLLKHSYLEPFLFYAHYYHQQKTNKSLAIIQQILQ